MIETQEGSLYETKQNETYQGFAIIAKSANERSFRSIFYTDGSGREGREGSNNNSNIQTSKFLRLSFFVSLSSSSSSSSLRTRDSVDCSSLNGAQHDEDAQMEERWSASFVADFQYQVQQLHRNIAGCIGAESWYDWVHDSEQQLHVSCSANAEPLQDSCILEILFESVTCCRV